MAGDVENVGGIGISLEIDDKTENQLSAIENRLLELVQPRKVLVELGYASPKGGTNPAGHNEAEDKLVRSLTQGLNKFTEALAKVEIKIDPDSISSLARAIKEAVQGTDTGGGGVVALHRSIGFAASYERSAARATSATESRALASAVATGIARAEQRRPTPPPRPPERGRAEPSGPTFAPPPPKGGPIGFKMPEGERDKAEQDRQAAASRRKGIRDVSDPREGMSTEAAPPGTYRPPLSVARRSLGGVTPRSIRGMDEPLDPEVEERLDRITSRRRRYRGEVPPSYTFGKIRSKGPHEKFPNPRVVERASVTPRLTTLSTEEQVDLVPQPGWRRPPRGKAPEQGAFLLEDLARFNRPRAYEPPLLQRRTSAYQIAELETRRAIPLKPPAAGRAMTMDELAAWNASRPPEPRKIKVPGRFEGQADNRETLYVPPIGGRPAREISDESVIDEPIPARLRRAFGVPGAKLVDLGGRQVRRRLRRYSSVDPGIAALRTQIDTAISRGADRGRVQELQAQLNAAIAAVEEGSGTSAARFNAEAEDRAIWESEQTSGVRRTGDKQVDRQLAGRKTAAVIPAVFRKTETGRLFLPTLTRALSDARRGGGISTAYRIAPRDISRVDLSKIEVPNKPNATDAEKKDYLQGDLRIPAHTPELVDYLRELPKSASRDVVRLDQRFGPLAGVRIERMSRSARFAEELVKSFNAQGQRVSLDTFLDRRDGDPLLRPMFGLAQETLAKAALTEPRYATAEEQGAAFMQRPPTPHPLDTSPQFDVVSSRGMRLGKHKRRWSRRQQGRWRRDAGWRRGESGEMLSPRDLDWIRLVGKGQAEARDLTWGEEGEVLDPDIADLLQQLELYKMGPAEYRPSAYIDKKTGEYIDPQNTTRFPEVSRSDIYARMYGERPNTGGAAGRAYPELEWRKDFGKYLFQQIGLAPKVDEQGRPISVYSWQKRSRKPGEQEYRPGIVGELGKRYGTVPPMYRAIIGAVRGEVAELAGGHRKKQDADLVTVQGRLRWYGSSQFTERALRDQARQEREMMGRKVDTYGFGEADPRFFDAVPVELSQGLLEVAAQKQLEKGRTSFSVPAFRGPKGQAVPFSLLSPEGQRRAKPVFKPSGERESTLLPISEGAGRGYRRQVRLGANFDQDWQDRLRQVIQYAFPSRRPQKQLDYQVPGLRIDERQPGPRESLVRALPPISGKTITQQRAIKYEAKAAQVALDQDLAVKDFAESRAGLRDLPVVTREVEGKERKFYDPNYVSPVSRRERRLFNAQMTGRYARSFAQQRDASWAPRPRTLEEEIGDWYGQEKKNIRRTWKENIGPNLAPDATQERKLYAQLVVAGKKRKRMLDLAHRDPNASWDTVRTRVLTGRTDSARRSAILDAIDVEAAAAAEETAGTATPPPPPIPPETPTAEATPEPKPRRIPQPRNARGRFIRAEDAAAATGGGAGAGAGGGGAFSGEVTLGGQPIQVDVIKSVPIKIENPAVIRETVKAAAAKDKAETPKVPEREKPSIPPLSFEERKQFNYERLEKTLPRRGGAMYEMPGMAAERITPLAGDPQEAVLRQLALQETLRPMGLRASDLAADTWGRKAAELHTRKPELTAAQIRSRIQKQVTKKLVKPGILDATEDLPEFMDNVMAAGGLGPAPTPGRGPGREGTTAQRLAKALQKMQIASPAIPNVRGRQVPVGRNKRLGLPESMVDMETGEEVAANPYEYTSAATAMAQSQQRELGLRALSTMAIQWTGAKFGPQERIRTRMLDVGRKRQAAEGSIDILGQLLEERRAFGPKVLEARAAAMAPGATPELKAQYATVRKEFVEMGRAVGSQTKVVKENIKAHGKAAAGVVNASDTMQHFAASFAGGVAGGIIGSFAGMIAQPIFQAMAGVITQVGSTVVDQVTGWSTTRTRTLEGMQQATTAQGGLARQAFAGQYATIAPEISGPYAPMVMEQARVQSANEQLTKLRDLVRASNSLGQLGTKTAAPGLTKNISGVAGTWVFGAAQSTSEILTSLMKEPGGVDTINQLFEGRYGKGQYRLREVTEQDRATNQNALSYQMGVKEKLGFAARGYALTDSSGQIVQAKDALDAFISALIDATQAVDRTNATMMLEQQAPQIQSQIQQMKWQKQFSLDTLIPQQRGMQWLANPMMPYGSTWMPGQQANLAGQFAEPFRPYVAAAQEEVGAVPAGLGPMGINAKGQLDASKYSVPAAATQSFKQYEAIATQAFNDVQRAAEEGIRALEDAGVPADTIESLRRYGAQAVAIQAQMAAIQSGRSEAKYQRSLYMANRALTDAKQLAGQIGRQAGSNVGYYERQLMLINRQNQALSLQLQKRQILTQLALARFQVPGETGEERYARRMEAEIAAGIQQKQLGLATSAFQTEIKLVDEQNLRAVRDAAYAIQEIKLDYKAQKAMEALQDALTKVQAASQSLLPEAQVFVEFKNNYEQFMVGIASNIAAVTGENMMTALGTVKQYIDDELLAAYPWLAMPSGLAGAIAAGAGAGGGGSRGTPTVNENTGFVTSARPSSGTNNTPTVKEVTKNVTQVEIKNGFDVTFNVKSMDQDQVNELVADLETKVVQSFNRVAQLIGLRPVAR